MVKNVFSRLIWKSADVTPYGTQTEEDSPMCTPVKCTSTKETLTATTTIITSTESSDSATSFVQRLRDSLRLRKKPEKDYDLLENRPSPFKTPPPFLLNHEVSAPHRISDSPFGPECLKDLNLNRFPPATTAAEACPLKEDVDSENCTRTAPMDQENCLERGAKR